MSTILPNFEEAEIVLPGGRAVPAILEPRLKTYFVERDGVRLRVMFASAATDNPRGSIIFSPGRTEFIEKYFETTADLIQRGFNVLMIDPRGQGLSDRLIDDRLKSYIGDFQDYADDMAYVAEQFAPLLPRPHVAMGHSMGGTVVLQAVLSGVLKADVVVCSAPMLGLFDLETSLMRVAIVALSRLGFDKRNLPFQRQRSGLPIPFQGNKLTSDKERYKSWAAYFQTTPRLRVGQPTYGWIRAAVASMAYVNRNAPNLKIPGLMLGAGADPIVDPASIERFALSAGCEYSVIPGALHELFLERDVYRDDALAQMDAFFEAQKI
ncbi:lysophospholipase [Litorimonas cladophorae]|uniref:Lysophospholipase n=1 Tax=Litorimonas cladophorae TaxID=1220491 RepID=A0A918NGC0_9PROT|nr:alpha/beta hydrolase [Litorimonas cladophorae]GGX68478.1 lysophospholipase [Litorimonas cladophorae]